MEEITIGIIVMLSILCVTAAIWLIYAINKMKQSLENINTLLLHVANKLYEDKDNN